MQESTGTTDRQEAERFLRQRLDARDEGMLPTILASKTLTLASGQSGFWRIVQSPRFVPKTHTFKT